MKITKDLWVFLLLFLLSLPLVTPYLRGDGVGYYAYVASAIIDHDLYFENEYRHADSWHYRGYFDEKGNLHPWLRTKTGHVYNKWAKGPSLFWTPFFLVAHLGVLFSRHFFHSYIPADGFSKPYLYACAIGSATLGFLGLLLSWSIARRLFSQRAAFLAILGLWWASGLPVYMYFVPFMSHAHSVFIVALFLWYYWRSYPNRTLRQWLLLGVLGGLMFTTYYVNLLFILIALMDIAERLWQEGRKPLREALNSTATFGIGVFLGALPVFVINQIVLGTPFDLGYGNPFDFLHPQLFNLLFSSEHGLWTWTPIIFLACLGFWPLLKRDKGLGIRVILVSFLYTYVIASYDYWHGFSSFSNRMLLSLTPMFLLGLSGFIGAIEEAIESRRIPFRKYWVPSVLGLMVLWNIGFIFQWGTNMIPNRGPISWRTMIRNQFTEVPSRMVRLANSFFTNRMALVKQIEKQDNKEAAKWNK